MKKRTIKKISIILIMLTLVISCGKKEEGELIVPIQTVNSIKAPNELKYEYPGVVIADKDTPIPFRATGPIVKMNFIKTLNLNPLTDFELRRIEYKKYSNLTLEDTIYKALNQNENIKISQERKKISEDQKKLQ